jgi:hypothetical protein
MTSIDFGHINSKYDANLYATYNAFETGQLDSCLESFNVVNLARLAGTGSLAG